MPNEQETSASRVAGVNFRTFAYKGIEYLLSRPLTLGSYADEEALVRWKRSDPTEFAWKLIQRLPGNLQQGVLNASAFANNTDLITEDEWDRYRASPWRKAFMLWTCLDDRFRNDPQTNRPMALLDGVQWCLRIIYDAMLADEAQQLSGQPGSKVQELVLKCYIVSQESALKNWDTPLDPEVSGGGRETHQETQSPTEVGPEPLNSSPRSTME